jgi:hypothetical protein
VFKTLVALTCAATGYYVFKAGCTGSHLVWQGRRPGRHRLGSEHRPATEDEEHDEQDGAGDYAHAVRDRAGLLLLRVKGVEILWRQRAGRRHLYEPPGLPAGWRGRGSRRPGVPGRRWWCESRGGDDLRRPGRTPPLLIVVANSHALTVPTPAYRLAALRFEPWTAWTPTARSTSTTSRRCCPTRRETTPTRAGVSALGTTTTGCARSARRTGSRDAAPA